MIIPTGKELFFDKDEIIVSKTNTKGHITYANDIFVRLSGYTEKEVIGSPHNIVRHPDMPRCIFKLLWDQLERKKEVFAYVTPTIDNSGTITSYHSNRRSPKARVVNDVIVPLYKTLIDEEKRHKNP